MYKLICIFFVLSLHSFPVWAQASVRPWMGVYIEKEDRGILIKKSVPETPAFRAGLKSSDIILAVDGFEMKTPDELIKYLINKGVGNTVKLKYLKEGKIVKETILKLEAMPGLTDLLKRQLLDKKAPSFIANILSESKEKTYDLSKHLNKVKIIEFWATWCGACMQAHPLLNKFASKYQDKISIIAISNEGPVKIKKFLAQNTKSSGQKTHIIYLQGYDTKIAELYPVPALPTFLILDQQNIVREILVGVGENLTAAFEKALSLTDNKTSINGL